MAKARAHFAKTWGHPGVIATHLGVSHIFLQKANVVMDGADWCQSLTDRYRPDAVRILDFPHAGEHISLLLEGLERAKLHLPPQMLSRCLHILKHRGPRPLLHMADRHLGHGVQQEGESSHWSTEIRSLLFGSTLLCERRDDSIYHSVSSHVIPSCEPTNNSQRSRDAPGIHQSSIMDRNLV